MVDLFTLHNTFRFESFYLKMKICKQTFRVLIQASEVVFVRTVHFQSQCPLTLTHRRTSVYPCSPRNPSLPHTRAISSSSMGENESSCALSSTFTCACRKGQLALLYVYLRQYRRCSTHRHAALRGRVRALRDAPHGLREIVGSGNTEA